MSTADPSGDASFVPPPNRQPANPHQLDAQIPNLRTPDPDELAGIVRGEAAAAGRTVDLTGCRVHTGWESVVLATSAWIYRFPRPHVDFDREVAVLRRLQGRLPVPIPAPEWFGVRTRFMAYRRLNGAEFDREAYDAASIPEREALAESLAGFLAVMHDALTLQEAAELGIPGAAESTPDPEKVEYADLAWIAARAEAVGGVVGAYVPGLLERVRRDRARAHARDRVLLHDDFNASNFALSGPAGELVAVWDFSCVRVGDPAIDLRYLLEDSSDLFDRVLAAYRRLTGRDPNPSSALLASRLEEVSDAFELDELEGLERRVRRWIAADGG